MTSISILQSVFAMGKMTLSSGVGLWITTSLSSCWRDAPKLPRIRETQYCFSLGKDYSRWINSNGFYSFLHPADSMFNASNRAKTVGYSENFVFFSGGELYTFLSTDAAYGLWGSYYIDSNIVKAQFFPSPLNLAGFRQEVWFRLNQQNKMVIIGKTWEKPLNEVDLKKYQKNNLESESHFIHFHITDKIPDPNKSWLKNRKWFWCSEGEYFSWRKSIRNIIPK